MTSPSPNQREGGAVARWQARMSLADRAAAAALGLTLAGYQALKRGASLKGEPRPANLRTRLACAALEAGLVPIE